MFRDKRNMMLTLKIEMFLSSCVKTENVNRILKGVDLGLLQGFVFLWL